MENPIHLPDGDGSAPVLVKRLWGHDENPADSEFRHAAAHVAAPLPHSPSLRWGRLESRSGTRLPAALGHSRLQNDLKVLLPASYGSVRPPSETAREALAC